MTERRAEEQPRPGADRGSAVTRRSLERSAEDQQFVPVIIKRTDEARRHPDDILQVAIAAGREQLERKGLSLVLSAVTAGLVLCFTAMAAAVAHEIAGEMTAQPMAARVATALVYPLGFVVCIMSGAELFTEHTATAVYPVLDRKGSVTALFRMWSLVLLGNLLGAVIGAAVLALADGVIQARAGYAAIGEYLSSFTAVSLTASAVLAGWLMALGAWLILSTPPRVSQIASIYIVTFLIGFGGLHHSIAGAAEMSAAVFMTDTVTVADAVRVTGLAVIGNLLGGSVFVAVLNYAHIRKSQEV